MTQDLNLGPNKMKGIILAGGTGSRLFPSTNSVCKQLLPVYDKPMIYYPLSVLMLSGVRELIIIVRPDDLSQFQSLLGNGKHWGINIEYETQSEPKGIPDAYLIAEKFLDNESSILILGDNLLYGQELNKTLQNALQGMSGASIFAYPVSNPDQYGVIVLAKDGNPVKILEKPKDFISNLAIPGLYIFDHRAVEFASSLKPSKRGETEITDIINAYLEIGDLEVEILSRGVAWFDSGTSESLLQAATFVHSLQNRQGQGIACLEEIAYRMGYIDITEVEAAYNGLHSSSYGQYLKTLLDFPPERIQQPKN